MNGTDIHIKKRNSCKNIENAECLSGCSPIDITNKGVWVYMQWIILQLNVTTCFDKS